MKHLHFSLQNERNTDDSSSSISIILKSLGIAILLILSIVFGILPLKWKIFNSNTRVIGLVNALSAGIFLSVALLHMLPEAHEQMLKNLDTNFPLAFLIALASYTFVLIIEKVAFDSHSLVDVHVHPDVHSHDHKCKSSNNTYIVSVEDKFKCCDSNLPANTDCENIMAACSHEESMKKQEPPSFQPGSLNQISNMENSLNSLQNLSENLDKKQNIKNPLLKQTSATFNDDNQRGKSELEEHFSKKGEGKDFDEKVFKEFMNRKSQVVRTISLHQKHKKKEKEVEKKVKEENMNYGAMKEDEKVKSSHQHEHKIGRYTPYVLLIALSFHGIFEGLAIGIQKSLSELANLLLAVALHKWAEALTLGMSFTKTNISFNTSIKLILIFSSTGPLGIAIGWILTDSSELISAIFMSISAGTFLYIASSELVVEEFSISKNKWMKLVFFIIGIALLSALWFLES